jgi:uncharacterized membrane protein
MMALAIIGGVVSFIVFFVVEAAELSRGILGQSSPDYLVAPLRAALVTFVPFVSVCTYFSYRVNKHINRLSRGKLGPSLVFEDE